jgi:DNA-binding NarL/FixJ family response regulator
VNRRGSPDSRCDRAPTLEEAIDRARSLLAAVSVSVPPASEEADEPVDATGLTRGEREVLCLLAQGLADREIGEALLISPRAAGGHVANRLARLGVDSRAAAAYAVRLGLA